MPPIREGSNQTKSSTVTSDSLDIKGKKDSKSARRGVPLRHQARWL